MRIYITKQGETFDKIAHKLFDSDKYLGALLDANRDKLDTFIFSAGEILNVPEIEDLNVTVILPPWRQ